MIERVVGNYKILEKVGEGGMGSVYRGVDLMLDRKVAIKVLRPELVTDPQLVERFRKEAVTLARLNHPAIAGVYTFFREQDEYFLVMEFAEGRTLDRVLARSGALSPRQAVRLFDAALQGIAVAHSSGVIHRDIKPENIMVSPTGGVKIMDFGIAWVAGQARLTRAGAVVGTLHYMSPEQVRGSEPGVSSDIYALGAVLYEVVTGRLPLNADSDFELMKAHLERLPDPPRDLAPEVPGWLNDAIVRALAKNPEERFATADQFRAELLRGAREEWPDFDAEGERRATDPELAAIVAQASDGPPPTRLGAAPPAAPPATRLAGAAGPPPSTRLADAPRPEAAARRSMTARAGAWWRGLDWSRRVLAGAIVAAAVILLALLVTLAGGPHRQPPTGLAVLEAAPGAPNPPSAQPDSGPRQAPRAVVPPAAPTLVLTPVVATRPPDRVRSTPLPAATEPPTPAAPQRPTPRPTPPATAAEEAGRDSEESSPGADPRDGAPTMAEAGSLIATIEDATDRLTKSHRSYLERGGRWRPAGADAALWQEIKALENATDRLKVYVRKRQAVSKLRKKQHATGWTIEEYGEVYGLVRDIDGRLEPLERALAGTDTDPEVRDNWQNLRSRIAYLSSRFLGGSS